VKHLLAIASATICCAAVVVHAQTDEPDEALAPQSQWLSASPDAPQMAFYWSGRLSVQGAWTWGDEPDLPRFSLGGAIEHESDHATARTDAPDVSLQLNDVALLGAVQIPKPRLMIRLDMQAITYVISCTDINASCLDFAGSTSFGGIADLMLDAGGARPVKGKWYMFGSVHGAGIDRANTVTQGGVGVRWVP
jgi:hypothetical protein